MTKREDTIERIERVLKLTHKESITVTIPKLTAERAVSMLKEQEPKAGKWERQYSRPGVYANLFWWCSVCKEPTRYNDAGIFYKYCPRCGAKLEPCRET